WPRSRTPTCCARRSATGTPNRRGRWPCRTNRPSRPPRACAPWPLERSQLLQHHDGAGLTAVVSEGEVCAQALLRHGSGQVGSETQHGLLAFLRHPHVLPTEAGGPHLLERLLSGEACRETGY